MGVNYDLELEVPGFAFVNGPDADRVMTIWQIAERVPGGRIHLGKSSSGWAFTFRAWPAVSEDGASEIGPVVTDFASWEKLLRLGRVVSESGAVIPRAELLALIERKRYSRKAPPGGPVSYDEQGNCFMTGEFC